MTLYADKAKSHLVTVRKQRSGLDDIQDIGVGAII